MDAILEHFGIPVEESMAFGDGENDLTMLVHAGIGVATVSYTHLPFAIKICWHMLLFYTA